MAGKEQVTAHLLPGCEYVKAGEGGVVSWNEVVAPLTDFLQRKAECQQVGTDCQGEFQQETAKEVVLGLFRENRGVIFWKPSSIGERLGARLVKVHYLPLMAFAV